MQWENLHAIPRNWLKSDGLIRTLYNTGRQSYSLKSRMTPLVICPESNSDCSSYEIPPCANLYVPDKVLSTWNFRKQYFTVGDCLESIEILDKRVRAWIAGFGMAALENGDLSTVFASLETLAAKEHKNNKLRRKYIKIFATSLLSLPKGKNQFT